MICKICGKEFERSPYAHIKICSSRCFSKNFWMEIISEKDKHIVVKGVCYYLDRNDLNGKNQYEKGFGGAKFKIKMNTGEIIETTNLWHNGNVPAEFRSQLPDNATFI